MANIKEKAATTTESAFNIIVEQLPALSNENFNNQTYTTEYMVNMIKRRRNNV
jgi:hypothetical protein